MDLIILYIYMLHLISKIFTNLIIQDLPPDHFFFVGILSVTLHPQVTDYYCCQVQGPGSSENPFSQVGAGKRDRGDVI